MLDTSSWANSTLDVLKDIHFEPRNVRLDTADAKVEVDIMQDLFVNESAFGLVEGFCGVSSRLAR